MFSYYSKHSLQHVQSLNVFEILVLDNFEHFFQILAVFRVLSRF